MAGNGIGERSREKGLAQRYACGPDAGRALDERTLASWIDTRTSSRQLWLRYRNSGLSRDYTHECRLAKASGISARRDSEATVHA